MKEKFASCLISFCCAVTFLGCTKNSSKDNLSGSKGLIDEIANTHIFATKFEEVDDPTTAATEDLSFLCFYKAPFVEGVTDYTKAELLKGIKNPIIYQRYVSALRKEIIALRVAGGAVATVGAVAGAMLSLTLWREQPVAMAMAAQAAKWAGGVFVARTGLNKATGAANDLASARTELLAATPFLITNLLPVIALPMAAFVNVVSKEKSLNDLLVDGMFRESIVNPSDDLGNTAYSHLRMTSSAFEEIILKISAEEKNILKNLECTSKITVD